MISQLIERVWGTIAAIKDVINIVVSFDFSGTPVTPFVDPDLMRVGVGGYLVTGC